MFNMLASAVFVSALVGQVLSHGIVTSPPVRQPGTSFRSNCGEQIFNNVNSDPAGNIQALVQNKQADFKGDSCDLNLCKGLQFADVKTADIQTFTAGQVLPIVAEIRAPHTGTANVSIVDTASNTIIGTPLIHFDVYASVSTPIQANQTHFSVTIPDLGGKCTTAGACVLQWWWDARSIDQTYESCVDFTQSGSGAPAPVATITTAAATTATPVVTPTTSTAAAAATSTAAAPATSVVSSSAAPAASSAAPVPCTQLRVRSTRRNVLYSQCGGVGFEGHTNCPVGLSCTPYNDYYHACL